MANACPCISASHSLIVMSVVPFQVSTVSPMCQPDLRKNSPCLRRRILWKRAAVHVLYLPLHDWRLHISRLGASWCYMVLCHSDHSGCELKLKRSGIEKVLVTSRDHFLQYSVQCPIEQKAPHRSIPPFQICSGNLLNGLTHHKAPQFYGLSASVRTHHSDT